MRKPRINTNKIKPLDNKTEMLNFDIQRESKSSDEDFLSLRDYFAGKVLQGVFSSNEMWTNMCMDKRNFTRDKEKDSQEDYVAQQCYTMAEAMLKERNK